MAVGGVDVRLDDAAISAFLAGPAGPVGRLLARLGQRTTQEAKKRAPVGARDSKYGHPSGYLRSQIGWRLGRDGRGQYVDISSPALCSDANPFTPRGPYSLWNEVPGSAPNHAHLPAWIRDKEGPYLRPALHQIISQL